MGYFLSLWDNYKLSWVPYLVLMKSTSSLFLGGWRTERNVGSRLVFSLASRV